MDRVLLMGYLEEMHAFGADDINLVVKDIGEEFELPESAAGAPDAPMTTGAGFDARMQTGLHEINQRLGERRASSVEVLDERMMRLEKSIVSVLSILKKIVATPQGAAPHPVDTQE
jgi:hypothetical protein